MDRSERFYLIDRMLRAQRVVPLSAFLEEMEISRATFKRDIEYMRSRFNAPIVWDRELEGYRFEAPQPGAPQYELPGLWFNASEVYALLAMEHLLEEMQPGVLAPRLEPLRARLTALLGSAAHTADEVRRRIHLLPAARRRFPADEFERVAKALLDRRRVFFRYRARTSNEDSERVVSPQRLVHYRDNWYLDAWCHLRNGLRSFSLDCIRDADIRDEQALDVEQTELDAVLGSGYGIFAGRDITWAKLRFSSVAARWVSVETWHPGQRSSLEPDGSYVLEIPYSDDRELVMDIMRYGPDCEVLSPAPLRGRVKALLEETLERYRR